MSRALDLYYAMRFLKFLSTPFSEWEAFKLGLIDENGKKIRKAKTPAEKEASTPFVNIAKNIKRILSRFPGGRVATASLAVGLLLMREECAMNGCDSSLIYETVLNDLHKVGFDDIEIKESALPLSAGRYRLDSPFYDDDIVYIKEEIKPTHTCLLPVFEVQGVRGKEYLVTQDHLRQI